MTEKCQKCMIDIKPNSQAAQRTVRRINSPSTILRHIILKLKKIKEKRKNGLKPKKNKTIYVSKIKGSKYKYKFLIKHPVVKIIQGIIKNIERKKYQPRNLCSVKEKYTFSNKN